MLFLMVQLQLLLQGTILEMNPIANSDNKPKKKEKKSKEKSDGAKPSGEGKSKKKKVVSSKKKLSSAFSPEVPGKCQEKVSTT